MHNSWGEFYPKGDEYHIPLPGCIRQSAEEQARDNMQAFARRLNEIAQLTAGMPVLQNYLVATLVEGFIVPVSELAEAFGLDGRPSDPLRRLRIQEPPRGKGGGVLRCGGD